MSVSILPNSTTLTPEQALRSALRDVEQFDDVMIVGTYKDNSLFIVSSRLTRAEALWLAERAKSHALDQ
jgi:hypothetical protein